MNKQEAETEAKALLVQESGVNSSYEDLRERGHSGYAGAYMFKKKDKKTLTTSADIDTILKFAKFDQALGTTIPELILDCCRHAPKMELIKELISLDTIRDKATVVKNVLDYTEKYGYNCLIICFNLAAGYYSETGDLPEPTTGMMDEIEKSVQYLIQLGDSNNVDMDRVLNHTAKAGHTLFFQASLYSEKMATQLLDRRVDVNTVTVTFLTPDLNGVNPHIRDYEGDTHYDYYSLSHLKNVTPVKSVYFIIKTISSDVAGDPWRYKNGIYPATFTDVIEQRVGRRIKWRQESDVQVCQN